MSKGWVTALVVALVLPGVASAAYTYSPRQYPLSPETLVEGHTVYSTIDARLCILHPYDPENATVVDECDETEWSWRGEISDTWYNVSVQRMGTAVAVLVRDRAKAYTAPPIGPCQSNRDVVATIFYENPAVLWFTDQFLVGDDLDVVEARVDANADVCRKDTDVVFDHSAIPWRYPCGGWVFATQSGNPDPRTFPAWDYTESYHIEDPNGYVWTVDRFQPHRSLLGVQLPGPTSRTFGDYTVRGVNGTNGAALEAFYYSPIVLWSVPVLGYDVSDPGPTSGQTCAPGADLASHRGAPNPTYDDADATDYDVRLYNALLFFFMEDLVSTSSAPKVHGDGAPDDGDVTGCQSRDAEETEWECGPGGDDREGNSHPYNPVEPGSGPRHVHPTASVDLYFSNVRPPSPTEANRTYAVYDTVGTGAPHHVHEPGAFDDRFLYARCSDTDNTEYTYTYYYDESTDTMTGPDEDVDHYESSRSGDGENPTDGYDTSDCSPDE